MTNALAQNIETDKNSAIDIIMQSVNTSSNQKIQDDSKNEFSNLMNNLDARMQKAQNEFSQKAKVSNTSSINKKALEKKDNVSQNSDIQKKSKNNTKEIKNNDVDENVSKNTPKDTTNTIKNETKQTKETIDENKTNKIDEKNIDNSTDKIVEVADYEDTEDLSDINNSSPVETSPVFPSEDEQIQVDDEKNELDTILNEIENKIEDAVSVLPLVNEDVQNQVKDLKSKLENLISDFENTENVSQIIEKVELNLDDTNFEQNQDGEILNNLNELKNFVQSAFEEIDENSDFSQKLSQIKEQVQNLLNSVNENQNIENENLRTVNEISENLVEISKNIEEIEFSLNNSDEIKENISKFKDLKVDLKNAINSNDIEKLTEIKNELSEILSNLSSNLNAELKDINIDVDFNINENLENGLQKIDELISKISENIQKIAQNNNDEHKVIEVGFAKNLDLNSDNTSDLFENLDKLTSDDFKNIDVSDKNQVKEILTLLQNVQENFLGENENIDVKEQVETLIKEINDNPISLVNLSQNIETLANEIKTKLNETEQNNGFVLDNTSDTSDVILKSENNNQNQNFLNNKNNGSSENELFDNKKELTFDDINNNQNETDIDIDLENVKVKTASTSRVDVKNIEENLQKSVYTQEIMDEMMVEVDIKTIPSQSGALSVSDEIAKMAIGESNALNSSNSIHGSITYDASNSNAIIKNPASLIKMSQTQNTNSASMEDILNQIGSKITQMQNGSAQKLTMILRPNDLGRLSIELTQNQNGLSTQILAQNEDVRAYIEKNINSLRQQLSDAGVNVNSIQIKTAGQEGSTQYDGNQHLANEQEQNFDNQHENKENNSNSHKQNQNNKETNDMISAMSNYDMQFAKDFSSVLNKSLNYGLN